MSDKNKSKLPLIILGIVAILIMIIATYVFININYENFPWKRFIITILIEIAIASIVIIVVWLIVDKISQVKEDKESDSDLPRQVVDTRDVKRILIQQAIVDLGINYGRKTWDDDSIYAHNPKAIEIRNERTFTDKTGQTSNLFFACELIVREGDRQGVMIPVFRCDLGKEHIKNNWDGNIRDHSTFNTRDLELGKFPLASSQDDMMRLAGKRIELADKYSEEELKEMFDPFLMTAKKTNGAVEQKKEKSNIKRPSIIPDDQNYSDNKNEEDDSIENDIKRYQDMHD